MITIRKESQAQSHVGNFIGANCVSNFNAFIGKCGDGPSNSLYLITYQSIVLMEDPSNTWSDYEVKLVIDEWVDLDIEVKTRQ